MPTPRCRELYKSRRLTANILTKSEVVYIIRLRYLVEGALVETQDATIISLSSNKTKQRESNRESTEELHCCCTQSNGLRVTYKDSIGVNPFEEE